MYQHTINIHQDTLIGPWLMGDEMGTENDPKFTVDHDHQQGKLFINKYMVVAMWDPRATKKWGCFLVERAT